MYSRLRDGCEVVSFERRPRSTPQKFFSVSDAQFCLRLSKPQDLEWLEKLGTLKKCIHLSALTTTQQHAK
jgi:hypothetical protein